MNAALIIFVRNPVLGKVKTRIAATLGPEKALDIYKKLLEHTHSVASVASADLFVFYSDEVQEQDLWTGVAFSKQLQHGSDLGERMENAFEHVFSIGYKQVIIIGSDCFDLTPSILNEAFNCLGKKDIVLGPSEDGGYYLLGSNFLFSPLFKNKNWSTNTVCMDTLKDIEKTDYTLHTLPLLNDVDTAEDCLKYNDLIN